MLQGSMPAMVTPMQEDGSLDFAALEAVVDFHLQEGSDALVPVGTTGESATLNNEEHCDVIRRVVKQVAGRIPVIAGTGANSTAEAIELTQCAADAGADACLLVTPYYNKPTQEGLYQHYKTIAEAVNIPQILYNVPGRTACDMLPETVIRLSEVSNIIGVKEATGDVDRGRKIIESTADDFLVIGGDDAAVMELMLAGGDGVITVTGDVAPKAMHEMCMCAIAGDREGATKINQTLEALHRDLFIESNPIPVKWALHEMGQIPAGIRLPLTTLSAQYHDTVRAALRQAGCL